MGIRAHLAIFGFSDNKLIVFDQLLYTFETRVTETTKSRPNLYRISCNGDRLMNHHFRFVFCLFTICFFSRRLKRIVQVSDCMTSCEQKEHAIQAIQLEKNIRPEHFIVQLLFVFRGLAFVSIHICSFAPFLLFTIEKCRLSNVKWKKEARGKS